jgi:hypothetical protein
VKTVAEAGTFHRRRNFINLGSCGLHLTLRRVALTSLKMPFSTFPFLQKQLRAAKTADR